SDYRYPDNIVISPQNLNFHYRHLDTPFCALSSTTYAKPQPYIQTPPFTSVLSYPHASPLTLAQVLRPKPNSFD
ncbi:hypothetical protein COCC4DRAFT_34820, partial [Bipolaris maydis ATCC 48331]